MKTYKAPLTGSQQCFTVQCQSVTEKLTVSTGYSAENEKY